MNTCHSPDGNLRPELIEKAINSKQRYDYFAMPKLVSIENYIMRVGKILPFEAQKFLYEIAQGRGV